MHIEKKPGRADRCRRQFYFYSSARDAFQAFLTSLALRPRDIVLLPAYIGWSPNEGSGVFDPIRKLGVGYAFYRLDELLRVDLEHFKWALEAYRPRVVVIIHYFGHVDPAYAEMVHAIRPLGAWILEDEAHAMLTDLVSGASGRLGDACLFSFHKILPIQSGGALVVNSNQELPIEPPTACGAVAETASSLVWEYDLVAIANHRRRNAAVISELIRPLAGELDPLWTEWPPDEVPHSYPVIVRESSRDRLYFDLNAAGFGVVSLYHTLIEEIRPQDFPETHALARTILNLPLHQDVEPNELEALLVKMHQEVRAA